MEVVEAVSDVWGQDRVGVRLSSLGTFNDMGDDDPETTFGHVAEKLNGGARLSAHCQPCRPSWEPAPGVQPPLHCRMASSIRAPAFVPNDLGRSCHRAGCCGSRRKPSRSVRKTLTTKSSCRSRRPTDRRSLRADRPTNRNRRFHWRVHKGLRSSLQVRESTTPRRSTQVWGIGYHLRRPQCLFRRSRGLGPPLFMRHYPDCTEYLITIKTCASLFLTRIVPSGGSKTSNAPSSFSACV
jgi:hypothetical protein